MAPRIWLALCDCTGLEPTVVYPYPLHTLGLLVVGLAIQTRDTQAFAAALENHSPTAHRRGVRQGGGGAKAKGLVQAGGSEAKQ